MKKNSKEVLLDIAMLVMCGVALTAGALFFFTLVIRGLHWHLIFLLPVGIAMCHVAFGLHLYWRDRHDNSEFVPVAGIWRKKC